MVRFQTGEGTCIWLNRDSIDAIGNQGPEDSLVVLASGQRLSVKGHTPDSMMFDLSDAWKPVPDGPSDQ